MISFKKHFSPATLAAPFLALILALMLHTAVAQQMSPTLTPAPTTPQPAAATQPVIPAQAPPAATPAAPAAPAARPAGSPRTIQTLDRVVAVVNDEVITRNDLRDRVAQALRQLKRANIEAPPMPELEQQILERMITDRALYIYARESGIRVDDVELDRALEVIARENNMVVEQLRKTVEEDNIPFKKFREDIRGEIIKTRLRDREVADKVIVTDNEVDALLATPQQAANEEFNLSHILVSVAENASPDQINARQSRAQQALQQLQAGTDFRQVAASFSDAPDALQGGSLGWRSGAQLPALFSEALTRMKPGEVSAILRSPRGFHIIKLTEQRGGAKPAEVQQTHARHILIKVSEVVSEAEGRNRLRVLKERIDNKTDFAQLARANSEDTSASKGGDLGWLSPGDTVPEFEKAMNALQVGEVSEPVRSPFGWHLIQVLERRSADITKDKQRREAREAIRTRKVDEAFQEWVRQTRDRTYVETRLEDR